MIQYCLTSIVFVALVAIPEMLAQIYGYSPFNQHGLNSYNQFESGPYQPFHRAQSLPFGPSALPFGAAPVPLGQSPFAYTSNNAAPVPPPFLISAAYLNRQLGPQNVYNHLNSGYNYGSAQPSAYGYNPLINNRYFQYGGVHESPFSSMSTDALSTSGCTWNYIQQSCVDASNSCQGQCRDVVRDAALDVLHDCRCVPLSYGPGIVQRLPPTSNSTQK